ncbi:MAG: riboflavin synthase, partial [Patescibacteria group bacterium]
GVSLTVVEKYRAGFSVALIPYTLTRTNLGEKRAGDAVNIECDMIAKYLGEMSAKHRHAGKRR